MSIYETEFYILLLLFFISLYPTIIWLGLVKIGSNNALNASNSCYYLFLLILIRPNNSILFPFLAAITIFALLQCRDWVNSTPKRFHILHCKCENLKMFLQTLVADERLKNYISIDFERTHIIFNISNRKIIKEKIKIILDIMKEKEKEDPEKFRLIYKLVDFFTLNILLLISIYRLYKYLIG